MISAEDRQKAQTQGAWIGLVTLIVAVVIAVWVFNTCSAADSSVKQIDNQLQSVQTDLRQACIDAGLRWNYTTDTCG